MMLHSIKKYVLTAAGMMILAALSACAGTVEVLPASTAGSQSISPAISAGTGLLPARTLTPLDKVVESPLAAARSSPVITTSAPADSPPAEGTASTSTPSALSHNVPFIRFQIVNTYPHDKEAFTQGLAIKDGILYEGTGNYGQSTLREADLETGEVLRLHRMPDEYFGEGITLFGEKIFQLTWREKKGFIYNRSDFALLDEFSYDTEGWGITHDHERIIMSDGSANLYFLDPDTMALNGSIQVLDEGKPLTNINELEYVEGRVFANIWHTPYIAVIDYHTGEVVAKLDMSQLLSPKRKILNGIAWDDVNRKLFVGGKNWPELFGIKLLDDPG